MPFAMGAQQLSTDKKAAEHEEEIHTHPTEACDGGKWQMKLSRMEQHHRHDCDVAQQVEARNSSELHLGEAGTATELSQDTAGTV